MTMIKLKLALPKGRMYDEVAAVLSECGLKLTANGRNYRPQLNDPEIEVKVLKPQNIPKLVELGSQDLAFSGLDWVVEQDARVAELLDLKLDPVRIVAAVPKGSGRQIGQNGPIRVASEYEQLTRRFLEKKGLAYTFIRSFGATEVFVPEDADMIVDNMASGQTLRANGLEVYEELMPSSTRLIANLQAMADPLKRRKIEDLVMVIKSVLDGRAKLLIEMNVSEENLEALIPILPCMKSPTIAKLYGGGGYALKAAVDKDRVRELIPRLKEKGASDILVFGLKKVIA
jgi:ATP phosphoribosyltransferase